MSDAAPIPTVAPADPEADAAPAGGALAAIDSLLPGAMGAIWVRELRARMRGKRAFVFITFYLLIVGGLVWLAIQSAASGYIGALQQVAVGRGLFATVVFVDTLVVVALAPAYTAGAISQEREKQTFDLLAVTPASSLSIVVAKLISGLSYLALVVGVSIPLASVAFFFGGIEPGALFLAYFVLAVIAIGVGSIGVACSAAMKKTQPATVATFVVVGLLVVGLAGAWAVMAADAQFNQEPPPPEALLYLNPFVVQADVVCASTGNACMTGVTLHPEIAPNGEMLNPGELADLAGGFWPKGIVAWLGLSALMVFTAAQAVSPTRRWKRARRRAGHVEPSR